MIFVLKEGLMDAEAKIIQASPNYKTLLKFAIEQNSHIKFIDYQEDYKNFKKGDILIYFDKNGEKQAEFLKDMGYEVDSISIKDIK